MRLSLIRANHKFPATQENLEKARELGLSLTTFTTLVLWLGLAPTKGRKRYAELGSSSSSLRSTPTHTSVSQCDVRHEPRNISLAASASSTIACSCSVIGTGKAFAAPPFGLGRKMW
jgi:hypothetical protein